MAKVEVVNLENKKVGDLEVRDEIFKAEVNEALVLQVIKAQLANRRQGTQKVKTKAEVRGGGKKPYKQKGTGNARRGSNRSPLVVGGGVSLGPSPRSYAQRTPKKMVNGAIRSALSDRLASGRLVFVDEFKLGTPKTKPLFDSLRKKFKVENVLLVDAENRNLELSGRNIPHVKVLQVEGFNPYDVVGHEWLFLSKRAVEALEKRLG